MKVYVKSKSGKWLMPTHPAKARVLLKEGKAKVIQRTPFAIQLTYETTEYTQPVKVGIDDGGVSVGVAAVSEDESLYQEEVKLRTDIKKLMDQRRNYRRGRRHRNTRYRKSRWQNRKHSIPVCKVCGGNAPSGHKICRACLRKVDLSHQEYSHVKKNSFRLPPSIKSKKDAVVQTVKKIPLPPPTEICLEDSYFDFQAMRNPDISGEEYQHGPMFYHRNYKIACKARDDYKCRVCGKEEDLQVHHIIPRAEGGTDKLSNLMTLCEECHDKYHSGEIELPKQKKLSKEEKARFTPSASHVQQGKNYLQYELSKIAPLQTTFGYITSYYRNEAQLEKTHVNDAVIIASPKALPMSFFIKTNCIRTRKRSLHEATARKGRKEPNRTQKRNSKNTFRVGKFCRWDTIRYKDGRIGFLSGFSGKYSCYIVDIDGNYIKKSDKNYKTVSLSSVDQIHHNQNRISTLVNPSPTNQKMDIGTSSLK